jgi:hypothetical protein
MTALALIATVWLGLCLLVLTLFVVATVWGEDRRRQREVDDDSIYLATREQILARVDRDRRLRPGTPAA